MKDIVFVCSAINQNKLINKIIVAVSLEEAATFFYEEFNLQPQEILGPFYKKTVKEIKEEKPKEFILSSKNEKAIYNNWLVNAFYLKDQMDYAYLVFIKRIDGKKVAMPKEKTIVKISELKFER